MYREGGRMGFVGSGMRCRRFHNFSKSSRNWCEKITPEPTKTKSEQDNRPAFFVSSFLFPKKVVLLHSVLSRCKHLCRNGKKGRDMSIDLQPGKTLSGGRYTIVMKIGEGGFSITYRAVQNGLNRIVCIKEYFPSVRCTRDDSTNTVKPQDSDLAVFEKYRQSFRKEAETLSTLHHNSIVEVVDVFDENNTSYMVMPFVEGRTLQQIVDQEGPLDYPQAVNYLAQVADAVAYIHERHILHRDIKPENIIITADYRAILIDFGSAREFVNDKTQAHTSILTHGYAPTEQYSTNSRKGFYTDIYALGATFYFVLTGKVPLDAVARMTDEMVEPQTLNPAIPDEANRTILKAMQMKASDRYQTIQEFMDDLRNVKKTEIPAQQESEREKSGEEPDRRTITYGTSEPLDAAVRSTQTADKKKRRTLWILLLFIFIVVSGSVVFLLRDKNRNNNGSNHSIINVNTKSENLKVDANEYESKQPETEEITDEKKIDKDVDSKNEVDNKAVFDEDKSNEVLPDEARKEMEKADETVYVFIEESASFPGGEEALYAYLNKNLQYPELARESNITGTVVIKFVVEKDGSITKASILREIGGGCGKEALRVVKNMPKWKPGKTEGHAVRSEFTLPVTFELH